MSLSAIVEALVLVGATPEMILAAVKAAETSNQAAIDKRRSNDAERQARMRAKKFHNSHVTSRDVTVTDRDASRAVDNYLSTQSNIIPHSLPSEAHTPIAEKPDRKPTRAKAAQASDAEMLAIFSPALGDELAGELVNYRKLKRAAQTVFASRELLKGFEATGDPPWAARLMMSRNWAGFDPKWAENERNRGNLGRSQGGAGGSSDGLGAGRRGREPSNFAEAFTREASRNRDGTSVSRERPLRDDTDPGGCAGNFLDLAVVRCEASG